MLYRLSISTQHDQFLLKGALLFDLWFDVPHRTTHDADLLGFGSSEIPHLEVVFSDICRIQVEDGIEFDPNSVHGAEIRKEANYAGVRIVLMGLLDGVPRRSSRVCSLIAALVERNGVHGKTDRHRSMVVASSA